MLLPEEILVISHYRVRVLPVLVCTAILSVTALCATAQSQVAAQAQKNAIPEKQSRIQPAAVAGNWQVSWQGRLGTEECALHLQQDGAKLTGTFQDLRGVMPLSGTVDEKKLSFEVQFMGARPFTTRFTGTVDGDKIEGTSQAVGVNGGGAFLGHAGEVVHPEHPWTAARVANQPSQSTQISPNSNPSAKN
jgi:hypothetical protein